MTEALPVHRPAPIAGSLRQVLQLPAAQFFRYVACSGLAALVNFAAGTVLVDGFSFTSAVGFPLAVAIAYCLGMVVSFGLNRRFTFASDRRRIDQARTFVVVALSELVLTTAAAALARLWLAMVLPAAPPVAFLAALTTPETLSRLLAIGLGGLYSFAGHKYLTFDRGIRFSLLRLMRALRG